MPRPKKGSPEAKAWAAKMRAARQTNQPDPTPQREDSEDIDALKRRIDELTQLVQLSMASNQLQQPSVVQGKMTGTLEKYKLGAENYPDPVERLSKEQRLARFAFNDNFELSFEVRESSYQTIDGVWTVEPKFVLQLIRKVYDEDTGELTNKRYGVTQLIFHEDPTTALTIAREVGFDSTSISEKDFLDEMRYLRMRDWLLSCFYPEPPAPKSNKREMVIGNRLVEVYEVTSEDTERIDFSKLKKF